MVIDLLKEEGELDFYVIQNMSSWQHSGFSVYCGDAVSPFAIEDVVRLAQYIARAPISLERMDYIKEASSPAGNALITYQGKTTEAEKTFTAHDFLARLTSHIPNKGEQIVRYYGYYSNKSRGMRKKLENPLTPSDKDKSVSTENTNSSSESSILLTSTLGRKKYKKNRARLIKKVFNIDPMICPSCNGNMKIIFLLKTKGR